MCKVNYPIYSVSAVANCILDQGKAQQLEITNLKLQKFAYFAQGWALARLDHPLFNEEIQAWTYGPVIPYLYAQAKKYENRPITGLFSAPDIVDPGSDEESIIGEVLTTLGKLTAMQLVTLSHEPQSPWQAAWNHGKYTRIPLWQMALYFRDKLGVAAPCE